jgi:N,N-dimethylformamidase beta subunit-like, C-terminal
MLTLALASLFLALSGSRAGAVIGSNPIVVENAQPGDSTWFSGGAAPSSVIDGYAGEVSVTPGQAVQLHVSTAASIHYRVMVYRLGWYQGDGARLMACLPSCSASEPGAPRPPTPPPAPSTGYLDAGWPVTDTVSTQAGWTTGEYLAKLVVVTGTDAGASRFVPFVVRESTPRAPIIVQAGVNTWQAYNNWGGKSLYSYNSTHSTAAVAVSFNRPYADNTEHLPWPLRWDYPLIRFLEREGYDVAYTTDLDTAEGLSALTARHLVIVVGHDEYWTKEIRDAFDAAQAAGVNMAFLGANIGYWQMRYADAGRTIVEYRSATADPSPDPATKTVLFRSLMPARPECRLEGVQWLDGTNHPDQDLRRDYVLAPGATSEPWFSGSGFTASSVLPGMVGYEWDQTMAGCPASQTLLQWRGLNHVGSASQADAVTFTAPSGARVFSAGTIQYSWGLDGFGHPGYGDPRLQSFTQRMLDDLGGPGARGLTAAGAPAITGIALRGRILQATPGSWSASTAPAYSYAWQRCSRRDDSCAAIPGATGTSLPLSRADVGHRIQVLVTATTPGGSASQASSPSPVVAGRSQLGPRRQIAVKLQVRHLPHGRAVVAVILRAKNTVTLPGSVTIRVLGLAGNPPSVRRDFTLAPHRTRTIVLLRGRQASRRIRIRGAITLVAPDGEALTLSVRGAAH